MRNLLKASGIVTAIAFAAFAPNASAQEMSFKEICQRVGAFAPEPVGDREGHSISVGQYSCRVESGPMDGAVVTGNVIIDWDKSNGVEVLGDAVVRKPGGMGCIRALRGRSR
jgi:hypothetical protein